MENKVERLWFFKMVIQEIPAVEENSLDNTPEIVFFFCQSCTAAMCGQQMAALDNVCFVQVARNQMIAFWVSFVLSPAFMFHFLFFISSRHKVWAPNLDKLRVSSFSHKVNLWKDQCFCASHVGSALRNCSLEWKRNFFEGGCKGRGGTAISLGRGGSVLSQITYICPSSTYLQYKMSSGKKKKISHNVAAKLLPGECACWEPDAIWKQ